MQMTEIRVWDPLVRTGHWLLATAVIIAWFVDGGFIGPDYTRFASFVRGPRVTFGYFTELIRFSSKRYLGHSPALRLTLIGYRETARRFGRVFKVHCGQCLAV